MKIVDPHLASSFFDGCKRVYLHSTVELVNKNAGVAECSLNIQVSTELGDGTVLVEHLETQHVSISPGANIQYTFPEVSFFFLSFVSYFLFPLILIVRFIYVFLFPFLKICIKKLWRFKF